MTRAWRVAVWVVVLLGGVALWALTARVDALARQVDQLQTRVDDLGGELQAANDALDQAQAAVGSVRLASDDLSQVLGQLDRRDWRSLRPAVQQALQDMEDALGDAEAVLSDTPDTPQNDAPPAWITAGLASGA